MNYRVILDMVSDFFGLDGERADGDIPADHHPSDNRVVSIYRKKDFRIMVCCPNTFEEAKEIVDIFLSGKSIILNIQCMEKTAARRVIDFISGAVYGLNGNIQKIAELVFLFTAESVKIDGSMLEELDKSLWS